MPEEDKINLTRAQIEQLQIEAGEAGDDEQVAICWVALGYDPADFPRELPAVEMSVTEARAECANHGGEPQRHRRAVE